MAASGAIRGALFYNLGLISERQGAPALASTYYRSSLQVRPGNATVERALAALGGGVVAPTIDLGATAMAWWRNGDASARDRLLARGLTPVLLRASASLNVRGGPSANAEYVRTLPEGTLVVALRGVVDGIPSAPGRGNWSWITASETLHGWVASGVTRDYAGCTPDVPALMGNFPSDRGAALQGDVLMSRIERPGALMFLVTARDSERGASFAAVLTSDAHCHLSAPSVERIDGELDDALVTWTAEQGGEPLLGVGFRAFGSRGGDTTWSFWRVSTTGAGGGDAPTWQVTLPTAMDIPEGQRGNISAPFQQRRGAMEGWWPVRVRRPGQEAEYYSWDGTALTLASPVQ